MSSVFQRYIRVAHRARGYLTRLSLLAKLVFKYLQSIALDFDVFELVIQLVALTAAVTINTSVSTTPIKVNTIFGRENGFIVRVMHATILSYFSRNQPRRRFLFCLGVPFLKTESYHDTDIRPQL